jgi:hypothetical protein
VREGRKPTTKFLRRESSQPRGRESGTLTDSRVERSRLVKVDVDEEEEEISLKQRRGSEVKS